MNKAGKKVTRGPKKATHNAGQSVHPREEDWDLERQTRITAGGKRKSEKRDRASGGWSRRKRGKRGTTRDVASGRRRFDAGPTDLW